MTGDRYTLRISEPAPPPKDEARLICSELIATDRGDTAKHLLRRLEGFIHGEDQPLNNDSTREE